MQSCNVHKFIVMCVWRVDKMTSIVSQNENRWRLCKINGPRDLNFQETIWDKWILITYPLVYVNLELYHDTYDNRIRHDHRILLRSKLIMNRSSRFIQKKKEKMLMNRTGTAVKQMVALFIDISLKLKIDFLENTTMLKIYDEFQNFRSVRTTQAFN